MAKEKLRTTHGRGRLFDSVLDTIGDTPCIRVNNLAPKGVRLYVKAEAFNPASSVKDRLAVNIIEAAERAGTLKPGQTVVEATSGNTGIGLAMVCAQKGYPLVVTMADSFSIERRKLMRIFGAKVVLTPRAAKGFGMYQKAVELAKANGWFLAHQFETPANAEIHESTTAREIMADFKGERLDWFVTGYGTGGTLTGVARVLRKERPETKIMLCEPANAQLVGSGKAQERARRRLARGQPSGVRAASDPGLDAGFHSAGAAGGARQEVLRRARADPRPRRREVGQGAGAEGRHLHRHLRRLDLRGGDAGRGQGGGGLGDPRHAARHRRALSHDAAVRRHHRRHGRRGTQDLEVDAGISDAGVADSRTASPNPSRRGPPDRSSG